ncbi:COG3650 family protein [Brevundimonas goettingensis]|uniref:Lipoprotein n=1 Tax=Brevundimonas goettingensis TaxID=2774190 RepID=A0A975C3T9_9CAUL|nr:hypothetical protein [Brevundimonas goettingensis]QTC91057.1 hypothetical protein IFJ75_17850 [Brevundimonas goettingensis]
MRPILLLAPLALLAACSQGTTEKTEAPADAPTPASLGGVDLNQPLRALGTEPFWSVEITKDAMVYTGVDRDTRRAANPQPVVLGAKAVYTAATEDGAEMVVTLIATECSDGMSDRLYPLTARVQMGEATLTGCAASQTFLNSQPPA